MAERKISPYLNVFKTYKKVNIINPFILGGSLDPDAQAYITAAGITVGAQKTAINTFVVGLKAAGLWSKFPVGSSAIYPFIGGTAAAHKFNLIDPRDLDAAFRLVFYFTPTQDALGVHWDGVSQYANTFINPVTNLSNTSNHISLYSQTNSTNSKIDCGCGDGANKYIEFQMYTGGNYLCVNLSNGGGYTTYANTDRRGFYLDTRLNTAQIAYKNGVQKATATNSIVKPNQPIYLGSFNNNGSALYYWTDRTCSFASFGLNISGADAASFSTLVNALQTALSRNQY